MVVAVSAPNVRKALSSPADAVIARPTLAASLLTLAALLGAALASVLTLAWDGAFPAAVPPEPVNRVLAEGRGWSFVTLFLVVPLGLAALRHARGEGPLVARLALPGLLAYLVYTYLELAVGPPFTPLYLVYIATFACALVALVQSVAAIDRTALARALEGQAPRRSVAAFGLVFALGLCLAWSPAILGDTLAGRFGWPSGTAAVAHVVHALDLGLYVPLGLATAILAWRRRPAGFVLGAIALVIGLTMGTALVAMVVVALLAEGAGPLGALPFLAIPLVALVLAYRYFRPLRAA
jgi:hypothetical protein